MSDRNDAITYFRKIVTTEFRVRELENFHGKIVGTFCNFVPEEIVFALGALPVRLCSGDYEAARTGEEIFPRDTCSLVKSCAGMALNGDRLFKRADLLVIPTPCDAKKKLGSILDTFKPVHFLLLPPSKSSSSAQKFWLVQVWELIAQLEVLTGQRLKRADLQNTIQLSNRRWEAFRRLLKLRQLIPSVISGEENLFVTIASFHDDVERWVANVEKLCAERYERYRSGQFVASADAPRILLTGAPLIYPNFKIVRILENAGAVVTVDEMCSGTQRLYQPIVVRDWSVQEMVRAIAEKCLLPCTCPCFTEHADRLNRIRELSDEFQVDGVVYHTLRVCPLFDVDALIMQHKLKQSGIPCLVLSTDYSQEDTEQLRTRIEAFLEMLGSRGLQRSATPLYQSIAKAQ